LTLWVGTWLLSMTHWTIMMNLCAELNKIHLKDDEVILQTRMKHETVSYMEI
jgi:hypothetical protein